MGDGRGMNSSFSSISFDAEIVKRFKQYAIKADLTHTGLLRYCLDCIDHLNPTAQSADYLRTDKI